MAITFTGVPTEAKSYVHEATLGSCRTHPCHAGYAGPTRNSWNAMPPTKGSA
ncbi:MAG TPA: hypothetical protein VHZ77_05955 [Gaiellaceae bacterium]|nr:hypothetical protein [Gaiellaceae bacterium]